MNKAWNVTHPRRLVRAVGFAILIVGCAEQPTSPNSGPRIESAPPGSFIKSGVVTATTICASADKCKTVTRYSEIVEEVGRSNSPQVEMMKAVGVDPPGYKVGSKVGPAGQLMNFRVVGRTLHADAIKGGKWHLEVTPDDVAKKKIARVRLSLDGKPLVAANAKWKDVGGAWYRERTDVTYYHEGRVALRLERTFSPIAVLPEASPIRSVGTLTPRLDYNPHTVWNDDGTCPFPWDVCSWFNNYTPEAGLNALVGAFQAVVTPVTNWFNGFWANADGDEAMALTDNAIAALEAVKVPSVESIAVSIGTAASNGVTRAIMEYIAEKIVEAIAAIFIDSMM